MPIFLSSSRFLRVTFPPEQFGMGEGVEHYYNANGDKVAKKLPHRPAKFGDPNGNDGPGELREERPARVAMLRKHPGNKANGGDAFWEQSQADTAGIAALHGRQSASMPDGGLTAEDIADLKYLAKAAKHIAPPAVDKIRLRAAKVHERFRVVGISAPPQEFNIMRLKSRLIEILGVLADCNIWDGNAESEPGNPGRGKAANG